MSLSSCLKKAGPFLNPEDKAAILDRSRELRGQGVGVAEAAAQAVDERLAVVQAMLADAQRNAGPMDDASSALDDGAAVAETPQVEFDPAAA